MSGPDAGVRLAATQTRKREQRRFVARFALVVVAAVVGVAAAVCGVTWVAKSRSAKSVVGVTAAQRPVAVSSMTAETNATVAEVPSVVGLSLDEAEIVLRAVGLTLVRSDEGTTASSRPAITSQTPAPKALAKLGSVVEVGVPVFVGSAGRPESSATKKGRIYVVCIDPGHQAHTDQGLEPLGPGSSVLKPKVTGGSTGVVSGVPEYEIALEIATNLQARLEAAGVKVVMTRTTNDVDISNSERAKIADDAKADLFIRIHADGNTDPNSCGVSSAYPASNTWTKPIYSASKRAARVIQASLVRTTNAVDNGALERSDIAGFNWSTVPAVLVEAGCLSNVVEDRLLSSPQYQDRVADGIAQGTLTFLQAKGR